MSNLYEALKEVEEEENKELGLATENEKEDEQGSSEQEEKEEEADTEAKEEPDEEAETEAEPDETPAEESVEKPDNAAFAKLRAEARKAKKEKERIEAELAALRNPVVTPAEEPKVETVNDPEPNKMEDLESWLEWRTREVEREAKAAREEVRKLTEWKEEQSKTTEVEIAKQNAVQAIAEYENDFKKSGQYDDYDDVSRHYMNSIAQGYKILNPNVDEKTLFNAVQTHIINDARQALANGYENPIEYMYLRAKSEFGYQPAQKEADAEVPAEKTPDLKNIVKNRKKSGSPVAAGGKSGAMPLTREAMLQNKLSLSEFSKLDPDKIRALES